MNDMAREYFSTLRDQEIGMPMPEIKKIAVLLVSPDCYYTLVLNLGIQMILDAINRAQQNAHAHRSFLPDEEEARNLGVLSIETLESPRSYQIIGFSIANPLQIINVYDWLDRAGIAVLASERKDSDPLIIFGGMGCSNPEPFAHIGDLFFMGESTGVITDFVGLYDRLGGNKQQIIGQAHRISSIYVPAMYKERIDDAGYSVIEPITKDIPAHVMPWYSFDLSTGLTATYRGSKDMAAILIDKGCLYSCPYCQYTYGTGGRFIEVPLRRIEENLDRLKDEGHNVVRIYSATATLHKQIEEIIHACKVRGMEIIIEPTRIDQLLKKDYLLRAMSDYKKLLVIPVDAPSESQRRSVARGGVTNENILKIAKRAYNYGVRRFSMYLIINYPGETDDQRFEFVNVIKRLHGLGDDIIINVYANPLFPQPNTPLERAEMASPELSFRRLQEMREQVDKFTRHCNEPTYLSTIRPDKGSQARLDLGDSTRSIIFRTASAVHQWIEGVALRGDRVSGSMLYELYKRNVFNGDCSIKHLGGVTALAEELGYEHRKYFKAIPVEAPLPWAHVRPSKENLKNFDKMEKLVFLRLRESAKA